MKKLFLLKTWLLLCALIVGSGTMWGEETTIAASEQGLSNGGEFTTIVSTAFTLTFAQNNSTNPVKYFGNSFRFYKKNGNKGASVTVAAKSGYNITKVVLTGGGTNFAASVGTYSNGTWTGSATSVELSHTKTGGSTDISSIVVTYSSIVKTDPTITFNNGSVYAGKTLDLSTLFSSNSDGAVTYTITAGDTYATIDGSTLTGVAAGDVTVKASQAAAGSYNAGEASATITVNAAVKLSVTLGDDSSVLTEKSAGAGVTLPSRDAIGDYTFEGWSATDVTEETTESQTIIPAGSYIPDNNITLYPVYTRTEVSGDPVETKIQTLQYDTWTYSGTTTDKNGYRLFGSGSYIESEAFDLSTLTKVIVYGGTYGGDSYKNLTIGDGTNTWKSVSVSGDSQTGTNTYTDGTALSGTKALRVTSNSGNGTNKGIRISKVEIYANVTPTVTYYTSHPSSLETATWAFSPESLETMYVGEDDATLTVTTNYDGTLTATSSSDAIATITKTADKTFTIHAVAAGDATFTITGAETENYKAINKQIAVSVLRKYTVTIETPEGGTLVIKNGDDVVASGTKFLPGVELTAVVTPDASHNFRNWQAVDASTHTYTASFTYTMGESDVTFRANFDAKVYHKANWSVNGAVTSSDDVEEGTAITFPAEDPSIAGYTFIGWAAGAIDGTQVEEPTIVTEANMGIEDVTYYAVFAKVAEENVTATFDASNISNLTESTEYVRCWDDNETGIELYLSAGQHYTSKDPNTWTVTEGTGNYFNIEIPSGRLTSIVTTIASSNYVIGSVSEGASLGAYADGTQTVTFTSDLTSVNCYATSSYQIRASQIVVNAVLYNIIAYVTTIPTSVAVSQTKAFGTFCSTADLDFNGVDGLEAYTVSQINASSATITKVNSAPAGTGLILKKTANVGVATNFNIPVTNSAAAVGTNYMVGVTTATDMSGVENAYILSDGLFYECSGGTLAAGKAYLVAAAWAESPARSFSLIVDEGETTGIQSIESNKADNRYYNIKGQRVENPTKGLYILNGKKVVIK